MKILLLGNGAREHALAQKIKSSRHSPELIAYTDKVNPGIHALSTHYHTAQSLTDTAELSTWLATLSPDLRPDLAIIGPDDPLGSGVVDVFRLAGIPTFGPDKEQAQIESSKGFARALLQKYAIPGSPSFTVFRGWENDEEKKDTEICIREYITQLGGNFVVKADGLRGGKGVLVSGEHLSGIDDGTYYALQCLAEDGQVVIEEKLVGEEFSLMCFVSGTTVVPMPAIQDHKRAWEGDTGPNTGGMGTYSDTGGSLPFLTKSDIAQAIQITQEVAEALERDLGRPYIGILYGGFMATQDGVGLIEYNARFGDPEAMNALALLDTDLVDIILAALNSTLDQLTISWKNQATVVKYLVPTGYPAQPQSGSPLTILTLPPDTEAYYAAVNMDASGTITTTRSRAVAVLGRGDTLAEAEHRAELATSCVSGELMHRRDIGTAALVEQRIQHMRELRR